MKTNNHLDRGTVKAVTRQKSSPSGNPAYLVTIACPDGCCPSSYRTSANASVAYAIGEHLIDTDVILELTPANRIIDIRPR